MPAVSDDAVRAKTGKSWSEWFAILDKWGAKEKGHKATAAWLAEERGVPPWWSQNVTVEYERARGLRAVGQRTSGDYEVSLQRTVAASAARAKAAWTDADARATWLKDATLKRALAGAASRASRTSTGVVLRMDLVGKVPGRLEVTLSPKGDKSVVHVQHRKLPDAAARDDLKARWAKALDALKAALESSA